MKKTAIILAILVVISASLSANPAWNPWVRTWTFYPEVGESFTLRFKGDSTATDVQTGESFYYFWDKDMILELYKYRGKTWEIQVEDFNDDGWAKEERFTGHLIESGERITGEVVNSN